MRCGPAGGISAGDDRGGLEQAGASWTDVVRTVTYVTDIADASLVAAAHHRIFADIRPAATLVQVSALLDPALKVEIEVYAQTAG